MAMIFKSLNLMATGKTYFQICQSCLLASSSARQRIGAPVTGFTVPSPWPVNSQDMSAIDYNSELTIIGYITTLCADK